MPLKDQYFFFRWLEHFAKILRKHLTILRIVGLHRKTGDIFSYISSCCILLPWFTEISNVKLQH